MKVRTFEGIVENGQVRLPADVQLPEKAKVYIIVVSDAQIAPVAYVGSPRLVHPRQASDFVKEVLPEPNDASL
jgi:virulence-associated protein VagC